MKIVVLSPLTDNKLKSKLLPLIQNQRIEEICLFRLWPLELSKVKCYCPPRWIRNHYKTSLIYITFNLFFFLCCKKANAIMGIYWPFNIIAGTLGFIFKTPVIQNIIGHRSLLVLLKYGFFRFLLKKASVIIVRGENTQKEIVDKGFDQNRIFSPPNVFDFSLLPYPKTEVDRFYDLIFVGNLVNEKRVDILLSIVKKLKFDYNLHDLKLAVLGSGSQQGRLVNITQDYQIADNVFFVGHQDNVFDYLEKSKVFVMTSEYEGLPMALIEALSSGIPCVMPDIADISTVLINEYNGYLIPFGDIDLYADKIYHLLTEEELYKTLSHNAMVIRHEKKHEYSKDNAIEIWNTILHKIN